MKLVLHGLKEKTIKTARGDSVIWNFKSGDLWYSAFQGSWNADWVEGMEIDVPDDRIKVTTKGDYTYHNIQAPPAAEQKEKAKSDMLRALSGIEAIWKDLQVVKSDLKKIKDKLGVQ